MDSYLDYALNHKPAENAFVNFFVSRARFPIAIVEKIVDLVESFFKLVFVALPAVVNFANSRHKAREKGQEVVDSLKDIPIGLTGLIFGQSAALSVKNTFYGEVKKVSLTATTA